MSADDFAPTPERIEEIRAILDALVADGSLDAYEMTGTGFRAKLSERTIAAYEAGELDDDIALVDALEAARRATS